MIAAMRPLRAIVVDALGTIVELPPPWAQFATLLEERHGVEVPLETVRRGLLVEMAHYRDRCVSAGTPAALAALRLACAEILATELGGASAAIPRDALIAVLMDSLRFRPYDDALRALARWRAEGLAVVVASNWDISLHGVLEQTGLRPLLDGVITSAEVGVSKPAREVFDAALALVGVAPEQALHVGDSLREDVEGARAAGLSAVWLCRDPATDAAPAGVRTIRSLDQLSLTAEPTG
jgi:putative hydrolase of the HAD superfamily